MGEPAGREKLASILAAAALCWARRAISQLFATFDESSVRFRARRRSRRPWRVEGRGLAVAPGQGQERESKCKVDPRARRERLALGWGLDSPTGTGAVCAPPVFDDASPSWGSGIANGGQLDALAG